MDPEDIEFLAEKQTITIIPNFNSPTIHFISGDVGPLRGGLPSKVPLWFALSLKQQQKCVIIPPSWMAVDFLEELYNSEKSSKMFVKMPSEHYMVEAKLILGCASDNIEKHDEIRTFIKDIWDIRMAKIRTSINTLIREQGLHAAVDNLTIMEINTARPLLPHALDQLHRILKAKGGTSQNTRPTNSSHNTSSLL